MPTPPVNRLTRREREIVHVLFALGNRASAEQIRARLADAPSSSAVRTMLTRLEVKGHLRHEVEGSRYIYSATTSSTAARRRALRDVVTAFFDGSAQQVVLSLIRRERWTDRDLDELQAAIAEARRQGRDN